MAIPSVNMFSQQPGGGIVTAMNGTNALAKNMLETAYYPASQQAQIAAQNAYAQNLPLQNLATVLSNPNLYAGADKRVVNALLDRYTQMANNPPSVQSMAGGNQLSGGLLGKFMNMIGGGSPSAPQSQPNQLQNGYPPQQGGYGGGYAPSQQGGYAPPPMSQQGGGTNAGYAYDSNGNNIPATPQEVNAIANGGNNAGSPVDAIPAANQSSTPGLPTSKVERIAVAGGAGDQKYGGVNPATVTGAQTKALDAQATGEVGAQVEQQNKMEQADIAAANEAVQQKQLLLKARELHSKIPQWQRGKVFGTLTPDILTGSEATELDTTMQNIVASVKKQQESGNAGVEGIKLATSSKPNRSMPDDAFNHLIDYNDAMNDRVLEKPAFNQAMYAKGYTPAQVATMWLYYQSKKPFYDAEHHLKDEANLNTWDKFYATPGRRDAAFSPTAAKNIEKVMGVKPQKPASQKAVDEGIEEIDLTGGQPDQTEGVIQETKMVGNRQAVKINGEWHWAG
jgi:hypothetical protein